MLFNNKPDEKFSSGHSHLWRELRDLACGDVFAFCMEGETFMVLGQKVDGIYRVVDHYFHKHDVLGGTPVYLKEIKDDPPR